MILIKEFKPDKISVEIQIEGKLDRESIPTLKEVCQFYLDSGPIKNITLEMHGLRSIGIEGKIYLKEIKDKVCLEGLPEFLRMELCENEK